MLTEKEVKYLKLVRKSQNIKLTIGIVALVAYFVLFLYLLKFGDAAYNRKIYFIISAYCGVSFWLGFLLIVVYINNNRLLKIIDKLYKP